ncbi:hypothetical protein PRIPAC_82674 [Pristionchus pacificus]|uniref:Uncharacterized protein n=1 Tax=Pristionchus pacificus TaxID=54126 RepID=A0A2A6BVY2_PRIPA|nr:hypothetical protein PRIPAC_82674 [Pristionchus pacificus]|eukprot:PDM69943.1 hypothetical protein PRIPAC_49155 [Pristionchus pacificus]
MPTPLLLLLLLSSSTSIITASKDASKEETRDAKDEIDHVLHVDTGPTQLVVVTSKDGPVDALSVRIELTDILDGRTNPPFVASGLWMLVNRGRYTIPFLRPDRWYGVHFTSERGFGDNHVRVLLTKLIYRLPPCQVAHSEYRLVKTPPKTGALLIENTQHEEETREEQRMFDVRMHRAGPEHTANVEGVYVTVRWTSKERVNGSELAVELRVKCDSSIANEDVVLPYNQEGVTVEIAMDHKYELEEVNATSHQMMAKITPLRCHQICWRPWLRTTADSKIFSKDFGEQCHDVGGTTSTTFLRNFKYYTLHDGVLVVETEHHKSGEVDEGAVILTAVPIGARGKGMNGSEGVVEEFSTEQTDGKFAVHLDDPGYYAVKYQYTKLKPFHYSTEERFLVESEGRNSSDPLRPLVELRYEPHSLVELPKPHTTDPPSLIFYRPPEYEGTDVHVYIEPFCGAKREKITLTDTYQHHEIEPMLLKKALCRQQPGFYFCDATWRNETIVGAVSSAAAKVNEKVSNVAEKAGVALNESLSSAEETIHDVEQLGHTVEERENHKHHHSDLHPARSRHRRDTAKDTVAAKDAVPRRDSVTSPSSSDSCAPLVCYTVDVELDGHRYAMGSRCSDVTQHFDMVTTKTTTSTTRIMSSLIAMIIVIMIR